VACVLLDAHPNVDTSLMLLWYGCEMPPDQHRRAAALAVSACRSCRCQASSGGRCAVLVGTSVVATGSRADCRRRSRCRWSPAHPRRHRHARRAVGPPSQRRCSARGRRVVCSWRDAHSGRGVACTAPRTRAARHRHRVAARPVRPLLGAAARHQGGAPVLRHRQAMLLACEWAASVTSCRAQPRCRGVICDSLSRVTAGGRRLHAGRHHCRRRSSCSSRSNRLNREMRVWAAMAISVGYGRRVRPLAWRWR
jgi:hypothetical protein